MPGNKAAEIPPMTSESEPEAFPAQMDIHGNWSEPYGELVGTGQIGAVDWGNPNFNLDPWVTTTLPTAGAGITTTVPGIYTTDSAVAVTNSIATVTRIVGNDLVYVMTAADGPLVFTPDRISDYKGDALKRIGIREGAQVHVTIDKARRIIVAVKDPSS